MVQIRTSLDIILTRGNDISFRPVGFFDLHSGIKPKSANLV